MAQPNTIQDALALCGVDNGAAFERFNGQTQAQRIAQDVFDGVFLDSPDAFTFGPQMVKAMRSVSHDVVLDIHLCVERPARFVSSMKNAGASRITFQWEAMDSFDDAKSLAQDIVNNSMKCGVSLNPETDIQAIIPLLETGLCDTVNVLGVNPGA